LSVGLELGDYASAGEQMEDSHYQSDDQKRMDQASANVERESEKPHHYQDRSNRKQHIFTLGRQSRQLGIQIRGVWQVLSN
jgi:hypothetical protein